MTAPLLDRTVLQGALGSGLACLGVGLAVTGSIPLVLVGAAYVVGASVFLAAAYARGPMRPPVELVVWVLPWLVAVALFVWVFAGVSDGALPALYAALVVATGCYLAWQTLALAGRQLIGRRARGTRLS